MAQPGIRRRVAIRLRRILHLDQIEASARRLDDRLGGLEAREAQVDARLNGLHTRLEGLDARLESLDAELGRRHADQMGMLLAIAAEDAENRRRLWRARETEHYAAAFTDPAPLVSVVIPTLARPDTLLERALPSVLAQSHVELEVIVVGDAAGPEVAEAVRSVPDPRVRFHNLSLRLPRPQDPRRAWSMASVMARNEGFRLARGQWQLSFDDDDELHADAVRTLVAAARERRAEVVYGRFRSVWPGGTTVLGEFPPREGQFTWQSGIRHAALGFFERELFSAHLSQPNDIGQAEAMMRAGVRFAMVPDVLCDLYPSQAWTP